MPRLFIAIDTPPPALTPMIAARNALRTVRADVTWEPDDKLHCTLKFLGDTPFPERERIEDLTQHLKPGDVIETMIVNVDRKTRSINLSIKANNHVEQSQAMQKLASESSASSGTTNLGALLKAKLNQH